MTRTTDPIVVDTARREVRVRGREVHIPGMAFELLATLMAAEGRVLSRDVLWAHSHRLDAGKVPEDSRVIDQWIRRLRIRLGRDAGWIRTVTGFGYRYARPSPEHRHSRRPS